MFLFKKSTLLNLGLVFMLAGCGGGSGSVNYSLNYSDFTGSIFQTINFSRNVVTENDPSTLIGVTDSGQEDIFMPDSRSNTNNPVSAFRFIAEFENKSIAFYVNPEFGNQAAAEAQATNYAEVIGRIPLFLRDGINSINGVSIVYLHKGFEPLVGNQNYLAIYTDRAEELFAQGILEEVLIHESAHVSLDLDLAGSSEWLTAQSNDGNAISQLAHDLGNDEDAAESLLAYIAVRYRANRLPAASFGLPSAAQTISDTIPNRIVYFDNRAFDMNPIEEDPLWDNTSALTSFWQHPSLFAYYEQWEQTVILF